MENDLADYLLADATLQALLVDRIYWVQLPQGSARPYLLLSIVSSVPDVVYDGATGLVQNRVQFDCWGEDYYQAKNVARAVATLLNGKKFTTPSSGGTRFEGFFIEAERDGHDDVEAPDDLFRTSLDFIIWHKGA